MIAKLCIDSPQILIGHGANGHRYTTMPYIDDLTEGEGKYTWFPNMTAKQEEMLTHILKNNKLQPEDIVNFKVISPKEDDVIYITLHALNRLSERLNWNKKTAIRMIPKVFERGVKSEEAGTYVANWLRKKEDLDYINSQCLIYGDNVFVFNKDFNTLITVYKVLNKATNAKHYEYLSAKKAQKKFVAKEKKPKDKKMSKRTHDKIAYRKFFLGGSDEVCFQ